MKSIIVEEFREGDVEIPEQVAIGKEVLNVSVSKSLEFDEM